jgi:hypothetical protein
MKIILHFALLGISILYVVYVTTHFRRREEHKKGHC